jgi:hypothetical protein
VVRPDIAFRTRSTTYHPQVPQFGVRPAPQAPARVHVPVSAPAPRAAPAPVPTAPVVVASPRPQAAPAATARAAAVATPFEAPVASLRDRIGSETSPTILRASGGGDRGPLEFAGALWQLRVAIIAVLVVLIGVFSIPAIRSYFGGGGAATYATVNANTAVSAPEWTYSVGTTRRATRLGQAQAHGAYYIVQIAATNRSRAGADLQPSNFALATENAGQYAAQSFASGVYSSDLNPDSPYLWPTEFPVGKPVVVALIFDVDPAITGAELVMLDVPSTRVRLN